MKKAPIVILALTLIQTHPFALAKAERESGDLFKVGTVTRSFAPNEPYNWRGAQTHALITQIWYPAEPASEEQPQWIGAPSAPLFKAGNAAPGATIAASATRFPLIMLSHGTGGSAASVAWLGTQLAAPAQAIPISIPASGAPGSTCCVEAANVLTRVLSDRYAADPKLSMEFGPGMGPSVSTSVLT